MASTEAMLGIKAIPTKVYELSFALEVLWSIMAYLGYVVDKYKGTRDFYFKAKTEVYELSFALEVLWSIMASFRICG